MVQQTQRSRNRGQRAQAAIECLRTALEVAPDYADAISISHCYYNEQINIRRLRITGAGISSRIDNPNGLHGRGDHEIL